MSRQAVAEIVERIEITRDRLRSIITRLMQDARDASRAADESGDQSGRSAAIAARDNSRRYHVRELLERALTTPGVQLQPEELCIAGLRQPCRPVVSSAVIEVVP